MSNKKVASSKPKETLVFIGVPAANWWENVVNTCSNNMVFFSSKRHLEEWQEKNTAQNGETLSLPQTIQLSIPLYRDKTKLDYARPSKEELTSYMTSMGLTGDFWTL